MRLLKKFWLFLVALMPGPAAAMLGWGLVGGTVGMIGISLWRSASPVNMQEALSFFSSCWTCRMFSDVMISMSDLLPGAYHGIGVVTIPMTITLFALLVAWRLSTGFINNKLEDASKIVGNFGSYLFKIVVVMGLLMMPLPRTISEVLIEPMVTLGTYFDNTISSNNIFSECMVATAVGDVEYIDEDAAKVGAFSPKLRHQLTCEIANIHQITGLGMAVGWTLLNMSFDRKYMHKILDLVPVLPNIPLGFAGLLILALYFFALLTIPLYFLEIFINLSMDLIMLPLMLMSWVFDEDSFAIFPKGGRTIRQMIDDVIQGVLGIGLTVVFLTFSIMFLNKAFGNWNGYSLLEQAIARNDSEFFIQGLLMNNDSIITVALMGVFIAMFLTMIPQLINMLFKVKISDKYYETAKKDLNIGWENMKKWYKSIKK